MGYRIGARISSAEVDVTLASLSTRALGFVTMLLLARVGGPAAVGAYSIVVNSAATVAMPFAQALQNNSTVIAAESVRGDGQGYGTLAVASGCAALVLAIVAVPAFVLLYGLATPTLLWSVDVPTIIGVSLVLAQLLGGVAVGFLYGAGQFAFASRVALAVAIVGVLGAYPVIYAYGLNGAFTLLCVTSLLPPAVMAMRILMRSARRPASAHAHVASMTHVRDRAFRYLPGLAATMIGTAANWFCTIYFVQSAFGVAGVGVVAVAGQWLNLMLLPVTSWGGVTLKELSDAAASRDRAATWGVVVRLVRKNAAATFAVAAGVSAASPLIASAYGLLDTEVVVLICINALSAVLSSVLNVFERLSIALDRQAWWLVLTVVAVSLQVVLTSLWLVRGLWVVPVGVLLSGAVMVGVAFRVAYVTLRVEQGR